MLLFNSFYSILFNSIQIFTKRTFTFLTDRLTFFKDIFIALVFSGLNLTSQSFAHLEMLGRFLFNWFAASSGLSNSTWNWLLRILKWNQLPQGRFFIDYGGCKWMKIDFHILLQFPNNAHSSDLWWFDFLKVQK